MNYYETEVKFLSIYVEGNMGWFSARFFNGLFCIDFSTGNTKYIGQFPEKNHTIYRNIISYKDQLFFIPSQGDAIGVYDRTKDFITCIEIPQTILDELCICGFMFAFKYGNSIYMFGLMNAIIVKFDIDKTLFTEIRVFEDCKDLRNFCSDHHILDGDKLYTLVNNGKKIIEITLSEFSYRFLDINISKGKFVSLIKEKCNIWITDTLGELFQYELEKNQYKKYDIQIGLMKPDKKTREFAWRLYVYENKLYTIAGINHASYIFDTLTKCFEKNDNFKIEPHKKFQFVTNDAGPIWFLPYEYNDKAYFQWEADLTLRVLDLENNQLEILPVLIEKKHYGRLSMNQKLEKDGLVIESEEDYPLDLYLDELKDCKTIRELNSWRKSEC